MIKARNLRSKDTAGEIARSGSEKETRDKDKGPSDNLW
jgi:hypothetical protein